MEHMINLDEMIMMDLYRRLSAWLLRNRKHKDDNAGMGRLASTEISDVHLETMEEAENKGKCTPQVGCTLGKSVCGCKDVQGLLALRGDTLCARPFKTSARTGRACKRP